MNTEKKIIPALELNNVIVENHENNVFSQQCIALIGLRCSGKSTLREQISELDGYKSIEISKEAKKNQELVEIMKKGGIFSSSFYEKIIAERLMDFDSTSKFVVVDAVRSIDQSLVLEKLFGGKVSYVLIDVDEEVARDRFLSRGRSGDIFDSDLLTWKTLTMPLVKKLEEENRLLVVNGNLVRDEVLKTLKKVLGI
jgi:adenylate kinase family enzyme